VATFCLVHGKWHDSSCWVVLAERLGAAGHDVIAPDLPFENPQTTYDDRIRPAVDALAGASDPVVVVGHSLGVGYTPLIVEARPGSSLVHLCPAPVGPFADLNAPMTSTQPGFEFPPNRPDGTSIWEPGAAISAIYPRLEPHVAEALAYRLKPGASPSDSYPLSAPPDVPTTLIYATHDEFFRPDWSRWVAREVAQVEPIELDTGHFPMIERPDVLAEVLVAD
jgi:pimeloyl-ACP methyl ester carboxylesterase